MKKHNEIDAIIKYYEDHMPKLSVLVKNKVRYNEVTQAIQDIADFAWATDESANVTVLPDDLTGTSICLTITSNLLVIDVIDKFCAALSKADNFEIFPKTDGTIGLGIVFENVFKAAPPKV